MKNAEKVLDFFLTRTIRARYAFCLRVIQRSRQFIDNPHNLIKKRWLKIVGDFIETDRLDIWHEKIEEIIPSYCINEIKFPDKFEIIGINEALEYYVFYKEFSNDFIELIEQMYCVGISNLYGAFDAKISYQYLEKFVLISERLNLEILSEIEAFTNHLITDKDGWGEVM